jgi:hypothetical protein
MDVHLPERSRRREGTPEMLAAFMRTRRARDIEAFRRAWKKLGRQRLCDGLRPGVS